MKKEVVKILKELAKLDLLLLSFKMPFDIDKILTKPTMDKYELKRNDE